MRASVRAQLHAPAAATPLSAIDRTPPPHRRDVRGGRRARAGGGDRGRCGRRPGPGRRAVGRDPLPGRLDLPRRDGAGVPRDHRAPRLHDPRGAGADARRGRRRARRRHPARDDRAGVRGGGGGRHGEPDARPSPGAAVPRASRRPHGARPGPARARGRLLRAPRRQGPVPRPLHGLPARHDAVRGRELRPHGAPAAALQRSQRARVDRHLHGPRLCVLRVLHRRGRDRHARRAGGHPARHHGAHSSGRGGRQRVTRRRPAASDSATGGHRAG